MTVVVVVGATAAGVSVQATAPDDVARLAGACSATIDERDYDVAVAARDAGLGAAEAIVTEEEPSAESRAEWADAFAAHAEQLAAARDQLVQIEVPDEAAWQDLLAIGDAQIDVYERRAAAMAEPDWSAVTAASPKLAVIDDEELAAALAPLGLLGRDCETMWTHEGNPPADAGFVAEAAAACSVIVDRRRLDDYESAVDTILDGVVATLENDELDVPALTTALEKAIAEMHASSADLDAVSATPADAEAWEIYLAAIDDRGGLYQERLDALTSGDEAAIAEAFAPDGGGTGADLRELWLDRRDCRSLRN